jgi:hypothetical protein
MTESLPEEPLLGGRSRDGGELLPGLRWQQARILDFRARQHDDFSAAKHSEILAAMAWLDHNRRTLITSLLHRR